MTEQKCMCKSSLVPRRRETLEQQTHLQLVWYEVPRCLHNMWSCTFKAQQESFSNGFRQHVKWTTCQQVLSNDWPLWFPVRCYAVPKAAQPEGSYLTCFNQHYSTALDADFFRKHLLNSSALIRRLDPPFAWLSQRPVRPLFCLKVCGAICSFA